MRGVISGPSPRSIFELADKYSSTKDSSKVRRREHPEACPATVISWAMLPDEAHYRDRHKRPIHNGLEVVRHALSALLIGDDKPAVTGE
jgi:hypothetical protein